MKVKTQYRSFDLEARQLDKSNRSIFLSFSSENPVERSYSGEVLNEVLDHNPKSVNLERLKSEGSVLRNHDPDQLVGKVMQVEIAGGRGKAQVRFGKTDLANETWSLIESGILTGVSVGYEVHEAIREDDDTLRVTRWEPTEISMVTNAADLTVGIGRSKNTTNELLIRDEIMTTETIEDESKRGKTAYDRGINDGKTKAIEEERERFREINEICTNFGCSDIEKRAIDEGLSVEVVRQAVMERVKAKQVSHVPGGFLLDNDINLNDSGNYSAQNRSAITKDLDTFVRSKGETRAMSIAGGATAGGNAVISYRDSELAGLLRERSPIRDLVDIVPLPGYDGFEEVVSSGATSSAWVSETGARSDSANPVLNKVTTELKELYSLQTLTQRMLDQSYMDLSGWIMKEMATSMAEKESDGFVNGTGTGDEPPGLLSYTMATTGDSTRAFGTLQYTATGNATALDDPDKLIELFYELKAGHRSQSTWLMNSNTARTVMQLKDGNSNYLWNHGDIASDRPATLLGRPVVILEDLPDIAANAFPIWVGDWKTAIRFINSSNLEITPDPYSNRPNVDFYSYFYVGFNVRDSEAIKALKIEL